MAGSTKVSTPTSAVSGGNDNNTSTLSARPSIYMKPLPISAQSALNTGSPSGSLTSKEWVVPPRPKPGRKPATDTPPTKRKAQNRAAQRAFRERRAARVGELEDQIKIIEDEHEREHEALKDDIARLEEEVQHYRGELTRWMERCQRLEAQHGRTVSAPPQDIAVTTDQQSQLSGCGNCTTETRCQCIDDVVNAMTEESNQDLNTAAAESSAAAQDSSSRKRIKLEASDDMEIDFTAMYAKPRQNQVRNEAVSPSSAVADPCGFCQDGTPCICAEMAAEQERTTTTTLSGTRQLAQFTPPPSEGDVVTQASTQPSGCASGPGTCAQCRADPNSTLFCKSLAASRARSGMTGGCCGGKGTDGGCCQQDSVPLPSRGTRSRANKPQLPPLQPPKSSITLSCADAYTTLSRHPAYGRASGEIATWLPKLHANPVDVEGRPALEIDAANVMSVLRDFDRRFGSDR